MDDLFKDIFGDNENKNEEAAEPIFEGTDAPVIKEETAAEPPKAESKAVPEFNAEDTDNAFGPSAPIPEPIPEVKPEEKPVTAPIPEPKPPVSAAPINNGYGAAQPTQMPTGSYAPPVSDRQVFYQPPIQTPQNNSYGAPQGFNQPVQPQNPYIPPVPPQSAYTPPKKSGKTARIVIAIIAVIAVAVAFSGIAYAVNHRSSDSGNPIENFIEDKENEDSGDKSDAEAEVKSSDEAAKKKTNGELTVAGVVDKTKNSCVGITVYAKQQDDFSYFYNFGSDNQSSNGEVKSGEGSGVIMSESGGKTYIMTCAHVIEGGTKFTVTLDNDKEYDATFVGSDAQTDIGVLSINETGLNVAEFGDSKDISIGEDCVVIGCPGGLDFKNSVTKGIVSALDVPIASTIGYSTECIQIDAAINPGNSGGALFNMQGQVIGINSSKIASTEYEGMGFAVPSNTAVETANSLIKNGYVAGRARLGIEYNTLSNYTSASAILSALGEKGFKDAQGTMVIRTIEDDSDLKGKVQEFDMIVAVNGKTMTSLDVCTSVLSKSKPGDTIKLTIARIEGNSINTFDIDVKLIESKK